jgi:hypothetical protein
MIQHVNRLGLVFFTFTVILQSCKFVSPLKAPRRLGDSAGGIVIQESIALERSADGNSISISFETRDAASCKIGFFVSSVTKKSSETPNGCASSSATKFSETISGIPKDQLVTVVLRIWQSSQGESKAKILTIPETAPTAGENSINLLMVDIGAGRIDLAAVSSIEAPSDIVKKNLGLSAQQCALSDSATQTNSLTKGSLVLQSATSRGFINATTTRVSPNVLGGTFQVAQRDSSEWSVTARSAAGFGQLRISKPTLMASAIFSGRDQTQGNEDYLEDIDPPAIKVIGGSSMVASWTVSGDAKTSVATLTVAPSGNFPGITCTAPGSSLKITIPGDLISKIPTGNRIWATLRLDSWQAIDKERWAVRVSDWKSMGVQRL